MYLYNKLFDEVPYRMEVQRIGNAKGTAATCFRCTAPSTMGSIKESIHQQDKTEQHIMNRYIVGTRRNFRGEDYMLDP